MLNPFYWYSVVWAGVLILYVCNFSDFCQPLVPLLAIFIIASILIGFVLGMLFKDVYNIKFDNLKQHCSIKPTIAMVLLYGINFAYAGSIPLFDSLFYGQVTYHDFRGIPTLGVAIMISTEIYAVYLCIQMVYYHNLQLYLETMAVVMLFVLQENRNFILVCVIAVIATYLKTHKVKLRGYVLSIVIVILFCYVVGGLGNIRHLSSWTDSSYIESLSKINNNYPSWLPKEFIWAYIYVVTPLANLNYNIKFNFTEYSFTNLIFSFLPNFITKKFPLASFDGPQLILSNFTASTAYAQVYKYGGWLGIITAQIMLLMETLIFTYIVSKQKEKRADIVKVAIIFQLYFSSLTIFAQIFTFDGTTIPILTLMIMLVFPKVKLIFGKK